MIDFFSIFTKGGIVLFCFQSTTEVFAPPVNALIRNVILNEQFGNGKFNHKFLTLQLQLDNEFDLVFVIAYQKMLRLSYTDKFLSDIKLEFRDKYKNELQNKDINITIDFESNYEKVLVDTQFWAKAQEKFPKPMKTFKDSKKSKKTVASMVIRKTENIDKVRSAKQKIKVVKKRVWNVEGDARDLPSLEFATDKSDDAQYRINPDTNLLGQMHGSIKDLEENFEQGANDEEKTPTLNTQSEKPGGMIYIVKGLLASKPLTQEAIRPVLDTIRDQLISKNVAGEITEKLCTSIATKLQGKVLNTFERLSSVVKSTLTDSIKHILAPNRNINILRDCIQAKQDGRPYVMTFCGVNGVGKTTNLAKICFWLIENNLSVLIAACDTFRAGAVEQLRTHSRHLNALHPPEAHNGKSMVQIYEKGYNKDAAKVASEAIRYAKETKIDVVLVDTAGRMQDNEPLMRSLAKLIDFNQPDLIIFVGEALVGNEAVNQLIKFNQAIEDHSNSTNPRNIDGILLTKFDTVDDKVGAAISMAYVTGKPIVFIGTGQSYADLKNLNVNSVVNALMK